MEAGETFEVIATPAFHAWREDCPRIVSRKSRRFGLGGNDSSLWESANITIGVRGTDSSLYGEEQRPAWELRRVSLTLQKKIQQDSEHQSVPEKRYEIQHGETSLVEEDETWRRPEYRTRGAASRRPPTPFLSLPLSFYGSDRQPCQPWILTLAFWIVLLAAALVPWTLPSSTPFYRKKV